MGRSGGWGVEALVVVVGWCCRWGWRFGEVLVGVVVCGWCCRSCCCCCCCCGYVCGCGCCYQDHMCATKLKGLAPNGPFLRAVWKLVAFTTKPPGNAIIWQARFQAATTCELNRPRLGLPTCLLVLAAGFPLHASCPLFSNALPLLSIQNIYIKTSTNIEYIYIYV